MAVKTFAAVVIGSTETEMRVYELTSRKGMRQIDCVSTRLALGLDAYREGRLGEDKVEKLCEVLKEYKRIMEGYQTDSYQVVATSALRVIRSSDITRDYIEKQTGLKIRILSNSEHRFLDYKSIACESSSFEKIIQNGTAVVDIGGNSIQISVFSNDKLITTQNIPLGKVSTREQYLPVAKNMRHYEAILLELMEHELSGFGKLYQKERQIQNLIVADPDLLDVVKRQDAQVLKMFQTENPDVFHLQAESFAALYEGIWNLNADQIADRFDISADAAVLVTQSMIFVRCLQQQLGAQMLWLMDVSICDGLCYNYGISAKILKQTHNFDEDIIAASRVIAKRYKCSQSHVKHMEQLCLEIFDRMKKVHGLKSRERLLLQIAAILHNCGKYISLNNVAECAYNIIMATEIIGLSHAERQIIANVVQYNTMEMETYDEMAVKSDVSHEEYLVITKLTAILRMANALDRSHKQKFREAQISLKDNELQIQVTTQEDLSVEKVTVSERSVFFTEVFHVTPKIRQKKKM